MSERFSRNSGIASREFHESIPFPLDSRARGDDGGFAGIIPILRILVQRLAGIGVIFFASV